MAKLKYHRDTAFVLLLFAVLTAALFGPVMWHFNDWLYGIGGDALGAPTGIMQRRLAIAHGSILKPLPSLMGAPFPHPPDAPFAVEPLWWYPAVALTTLITPIGASNALVYLTFPATGLSLYLLLRRENLPTISSLFGSLIYTYSPIRLAEAQEHLTYLPDFMYVWECALMIACARSMKIRAYVVLGVCLAITNLFSPYLAYFGGLLAVAWSASVAISAIFRAEWTRVRDVALKALLSFAVTVGVLVLIQAPLVAFGSLSESVHLAAFGHPMTDLEDLSLRWWHFLLPQPDNPIVRAILSQTDLHYGRAEQSIDQSTTIGVVAFCLAVAGLVTTLPLFLRHATRRGHESGLTNRNALLGIAMTCILVGIVVGLPPWLSLFGHTVDTPPYILYRLVPQIRTTSRVDLVIELGIALLAAMGCEKLLRETRWSPRVIVATSLIGAVYVAETANVPPWHFVPLLPSPGVYHWLGGLSDEQVGIIAQYPLESDTYDVTSIYAFYAYTIHEHRLLNGVISGTPEDALRRNLHDVLNPTTPASLTALGIKTVVLNSHFYQLAFANAGLRWLGGQRPEASDLPSGLRPAYSDAGSVAFSVIANTAPLVAGLSDGFGGSEVRRDGREWAWVDQNADLLLDNVTREPLSAIVWTRAHNNRVEHAVEWKEFPSVPVPENSDSSSVAIFVDTTPGLSRMHLRSVGQSSPLRAGDAPVSIEIRSLEPAPIRSLNQTFLQSGQARWTLDGASTDACAVQPGTELSVALLWSVQQPTLGEETVFVHLVDGSGRIIAQGDGLPDRGSVSTAHSTIGVRIVDVHSLELPTSAKIGEYELQVGLYARDDGNRLHLISGGDTISVGSVSVLSKTDGPLRIACPWR